MGEAIEEFVLSWPPKRVAVLWLCSWDRPTHPFSLELTYSVVELLGALVVNRQAIVAEDLCHLRTCQVVCMCVCLCASALLCSLSCDTILSA